MAIEQKRFMNFLSRVNVASRMGAGSLLLCMSAFASAPSQAAETLTMGMVGHGSSVDWPLYIGISKGFFAERGIKLDLVAAPSSASVQQWLASGSTMLGAGGLADPVRAIDKGAKVALLRVEAQIAPYALIAKPSIKNMAGLRGKTVSVGGSVDITRVYFERMAVPQGLKRGDYDLVYAGATSARYAAVESGAVDAAILNPPFIFKATGGKMTNLGLVADYVKDFPFTGYAVNADWGRAHKPELTNFLAAVARSIEWFYNDANRNEAIDILTAASATDRADVAQTYDFFRKIDIYDRTGKIDQQSIGKLVVALKSLGDISDNNPARFIDPQLSHLAETAK
jgi:ABC-type nitrate/sulfonate/bicarbonate transport system substrate-binding protein